MTYLKNANSIAVDKSTFTSGMAAADANVQAMLKNIDTSGGGGGGGIGGAALRQTILAGGALDNVANVLTADADILISADDGSTVTISSGTAWPTPTISATNYAYARKIGGAVTPYLTTDAPYYQETAPATVAVYVASVFGFTNYTNANGDTIEDSGYAAEGYEGWRAQRAYGTSYNEGFTWGSSVAVAPYWAYTFHASVNLASFTFGFYNLLDMTVGGPSAGFIDVYIIPADGSSYELAQTFSMLLSECGTTVARTLTTERSVTAVKFVFRTDITGNNARVQLVGANLCQNAVYTGRHWFNTNLMVMNVLSSSGIWENQKDVFLSEVVVDGAGVVISVTNYQKKIDYASYPTKLNANGTTIQATDLATAVGVVPILSSSASNTIDSTPYAYGSAVCLCSKNPNILLVVSGSAVSSYACSGTTVTSTALNTLSLSYGASVVPLSGDYYLVGTNVVSCDPVTGVLTLVTSSSVTHTPMLVAGQWVYCPCGSFVYTYFVSPAGVVTAGKSYTIFSEGSYTYCSKVSSDKLSILDYTASGVWQTLCICTGGTVTYQRRLISGVTITNKIGMAVLSDTRALIYQIGENSGTTIPVQLVELREGWIQSVLSTLTVSAADLYSSVDNYCAIIPSTAHTAILVYALRGPTYGLKYMLIQLSGDMNSFSGAATTLSSATYDSTVSKAYPVRLSSTLIGAPGYNSSVVLVQLKEQVLQGSYGLLQTAAGITGVSARKSKGLSFFWALSNALTEANGGPAFTITGSAPITGRTVFASPATYEFSSTSNYLSTGAQASLAVGSGDWTLEFIDHNRASDVTLTGSTGDTIRFCVGTSYSGVTSSFSLTNLSAYSAPASDTSNHAIVQRSADVITCYVNGVLNGKWRLNTPSATLGTTLNIKLTGTVSSIEQVRFTQEALYYGSTVYVSLPYKGTMTVESDAQLMSGESHCLDISAPSKVVFNPYGTGPYNNTGLKSRYKVYDLTSMTCNRGHFGTIVAYYTNNAQTLNVPTVSAIDIGSVINVIVYSGTYGVTIRMPTGIYVENSVAGGRIVSPSGAYSAITLILVSATRWIRLSSVGTWTVT